MINNIYYGIPNYFIDIYDICMAKCNNNGIITIPAGDINREKIFGDPSKGSLKKIFFQNHQGNFVEYDDKSEIIIDKNGNIKLNSSCDVYNKLIQIHSNLKLKYGSFDEEFPEQKMVVRYLKGDETILEIGSNIGRNSMIISYILKNSENLVTLETDHINCTHLKENRELNNFHFHIEPSALSKRKLIQKGWDTIPSDNLLNGFSWVNTITLDELNKKYNKIFDTLILDCEGAFYYILMDFPEILDNIKLIIVENDYKNIEHKKYVNEVLIKNRFYNDYSEIGGGGPCMFCFYEVWKRNL